MATIDPLLQRCIPQPAPRSWSSAILIIILLLASLRGQAKCADVGFSFWPSGSVVPRNAVFVIGGVGRDASFLKSLGSPYKVELRSGKQTVCLDVHAILDDQAGMAQVLLHPDALLDTGKRYQLWIEGYAKHKRGDNALLGPLPMPALPSWKAGDFSHRQGLSWQKKPKVVKRYKSIHFCPQSDYVAFQGGVASKREYLVRAHLRPKGNKRYWTAFIEPDAEGQIQVGNTGCEGVFSLSGWADFEIKFDLMDIAGNVVPWIGAPIVFQPAEKKRIDLP